MRPYRLLPALLLLVTTASLPAFAQKKPKDELSGYDRSARATVLHDAVVYVSADEGSQKIGEILPGHEMVIVQRNGPWIKVFANTDTPDDQDPDKTPEFTTDDAPKPESGWIKDKAVVSPATPNGDAILFGTAANLEDEASRPHARKTSAGEAHLLYERVFQYFPDSPLAGQSAYRSADIRWQLDKLDISTLPSAKEQEAYLRPALYEGDMRRVIKQYPGSQWAALASYDLLDNKLCGDWQGLPKCPEMEARLYMKYVEQWPESPKAPEAQFNAVYRYGVLVNMYTVDDDRKRAEAAAKQTEQLADDMRTRFPKSDFTYRAESIAFRVAQGVPIFGTDRE